MDDDQPIPRKRKIDNRSDHDLISDLPLNIIHCILDLVPIRDAVRTCILSKQWRYKWASLPHLVFDNDCVDRSKSVDSRIECLKNFVTNAILLHQGPIQKFRLCASLLNSCPDADRWLLCLSRNEIRELCLQRELPLERVYPSNGWLAWFRVHSSLYSFRNLTHLELFHCELPTPPPTFKGFSCLRSLVLRHVKVPSNAAIESLVANSRLLESFTYSYLASPEFKISAPNLKCVDLSGFFKEIILYAPLVAEVSVSLYEVGLTAEQQSSVCNYAKFLGGFTNLERLVGHFYFTKYLSIGIESYDRSLAFHHLKSIELCQVSFHDTKQMSVVVYLLLGAPNLQKFRIWMSPLIKKDASEAPPISFKDFGCTDSFTFEKLKDVKMEGVCGLPYQMEFIKFLLKSSPVLGKMTLYHSYEPCHEGILNMTAELPRYGRASPNAKILLLRR